MSIFLSILPVKGYSSADILVQELSKVFQLQTHTQKVNWLKKTKDFMDSKSLRKNPIETMRLQAKAYKRFLQNFPEAPNPKNCEKSRISLQFYISPDEEVHRTKDFTDDEKIILKVFDHYCKK